MYLFMLIMQAAQKNTLTVTPCHMGETVMKVYTCASDVYFFMFVYETVSGGLAGAHIKSPQLTRGCIYVLYCLQNFCLPSLPLFLSLVY